ncbi:MAG TPA: hypothetical protein VIR98_03370 [Candidatus Paceibacterota bacterium]|jgi:hypothetical protein
MERTGKNIGDLVLFNRSAHFAFVYQKTEKLVSAVYLVTNLISDNEPLKTRIRENALALMSVVVDWNTVTASERKGLLKEYQALSLEIISYASVARHAGLISEMNFEILKREFEALMFAAEREDHVLLDASFFEAAKPAAPTPSVPSTAAVPAISTPAASTSTSHATPYIAPIPAAPRSDVLYEGHAAVHKGHLPKADSKDDRQAIIVKLLSKKSGLSVKDFVGAIKGVSEKTIQRELLSMVAAGVLKKEGERRWSTYSLAK